MNIRSTDKIEKEYKTTVYTLIVLSGDLRNYLINKFDDCKKDSQNYLKQQNGSI